MLVADAIDGHPHGGIMTRHPAAAALLCGIWLLGHPHAGTTVYGFDRGGRRTSLSMHAPTRTIPTC
jgi:hypothetical protein